MKEPTKTNLSRREARCSDPQERRSFAYILNGLSAEKIAAALQILRRTVEQYTASIYNKPGAHNYIKLAAFAISINWYIVNHDLDKEKKSNKGRPDRLTQSNWPDCIGKLTR